MSKAHKGSRLKLKDQVVATDFSSAHFDFNVDASGVQYGDIIEPLEGSVYTMRNFEGKFGGGIAVDESTVNLVPAGMRTCSSLFMQNAGGTYTLETNVAGREDAIRIQVVGTSGNNTYAYFGFNDPGNLVSAIGDVYTVSYEYQVTQGHQNRYPILSSIYGDGFKVPTASSVGTIERISEEEVGGGWIRKTDRVTMSEAGNTWFRWNYHSGEVTAECLIDNIQIERKSFRTSFTDGTRGKGGLTYPDRGISEKEGTVSFWYKPYVAWDDTSTLNNSNESLFEYFFTWGVPGQSNSAWARRGRSAKVIQFTYRGANAIYYYSGELQGSEEFVLISFSWGGDEISIHVNGRKVASTAIVSIDRPTTGCFEVGVRQKGGSYPAANGIFSDLSISNKKKEDTEIEAQAISEKPLYNPYDYRSFSH